jgi:signal transduction histidine kinase
MQQRGQAAGFKATRLAATGLAKTGTAGVVLTEAGEVEGERKRVEAVVETLAKLRGAGVSLAEVAHDARNMVTALGLYSDLLEEPGVLTPAFHHYANELRLVATASRRLVEKLLVLDARQTPVASSETATGSGEFCPGEEQPAAGRLEQTRRRDLLPAEPIDNLAAEVQANRNLLAALAGPSTALTVEVEGSALPVRLTGEDLTRILVNLLKNAAEAMLAGGRIAINLHEFHAGEQLSPWLMLTIEDNGPGIPREALEKIFESGYSTRSSGASNSDANRHGGWLAFHRGLGLSITRSIVEAAGGSIVAASSAPSGARFEIMLPVRSR